MPWRAALGGAVCVVSGFFWAAAPYMVLIGKFSNRPSVDQMLPVAADLGMASAVPDRVACFAERRQEGVNGHHVNGVRLGEALGLVLSAHGKAGHYFLWPLAAVGAATFWRARRRDPAMGLLGCVTIVHVAMLFRLAYSAGYTSERHALLLVSLAAIQAAVGLKLFLRTCRPFLRGIASFAPAAVALVLAALCLPKAVQPLHLGQEGHRQAGLWLGQRENGCVGGTLVDPYLWASFYAGKLTPRYAPTKGNDDGPETSRHVKQRVLGVVDPRDNDLNRIHEWEKTGVTGPGSVVLWSWPTAEQPKLILRQAVGQ